jgi:hypothetical protein
VTPAADRAIDRDIPVARIEQVDQLTGKDRDMHLVHVK